MQPILKILFILFTIGQSVTFCLYATEGADRPKGRADRETAETRGKDNKESPNAPASPNISVGNINKGFFETSGLVSSIKSKFKQIPNLQVNPNKGSLTTSFSIVFPGNLIDFKGVNFSYNSQQEQNIGFGIGWSIDLPNITASKENKDGITYKIMSSSASVLIKSNLPSSIDVSSFTRLLGVSDYSQEVFRERIESSFSTYLRLYKEDEHLGFIVLKKHGKVDIFDSLGRLRFKLDQNEGQIEFVWSDGVLTSILAEKENWSVNFNYQEEFSFRVSYGILSKMPYGLKNIKISTNTDVKASELTQEDNFIHFNYKNNYLTSVYRDSALIPLFQGSYEKINTEIKKEENINDLKDKKFLYQGYQNEGRFVSTGFFKDDIINYVDLNSDNYTDIVHIKYNSGYNKVLNQQLSSLKRDCGDYLCTLNKSIQSIYDSISNENYAIIDVYFAKSDSGIIKYKRDSKLSGLKVLAFDLRLEEVSYPHKDSNGSLERYGYNDYKVAFFSKIKFTFTDLTGDGNSELVSCLGINAQNDLPKSSKKTKVYSTGIDKYLDNIKNSGAGTISSSFEQEEVTLPLLSHALYNKISGKASSFNYKNYLAQDSKASTVYSLVKDQEYLKDKIAPFRGQKDYILESVDIIAGHLRWKKINSSFKCNSLSVFEDFNNDSTIDVLTSGNMFFRDNNVSGKVEVESNVNINNYFELPEDYQFSKENSDISFLDLNANGKFEFVNTLDVVFNPFTSNYDVYSEDLVTSYKRVPSYKVLKTYTAPFGGKIDVEYDVIGGTLVATSKVYNPDHNQSENYKITYSYNNQMRDTLTGIFTGFQNTREYFDYDDIHLKNISYEYEYYMDVHPFISVYNYRPRLNGQLKALKIYNSQNRLIRGEERVLDFDFLSNDRIYSYTGKKTSFNFIGRDKRYDFKKVSEYSIQSWYEVNNEKAYPLKTVFISYGLKDFIDVYDVSSYSGYTKEVEEFSHIDNSLVPVLNSSYLLDHNLPTNIKTYAYYDDYRVKSKTNNLLTTLFYYDEHGRLTKDISPNGLETNYNYYENGPFLQLYENGVQSLLINSWDKQTSSPTSYTDIFGIEHKKEYSKDGILLLYTKDTHEFANVEIFKLDVPDLLPCENAKCLERTFSITSNGTKQEIYLDGFGRVVDTTMDFNNLNITQGKTFYAGDKVVSQNRTGSSGKDRLGVNSFYDSAGRIDKEVYFKGKYTFYNYAANCVLVKNNSPKANYTSDRSKTCYDANNNITSTSIPNEQNTIIKYDLSNKLEKVNNHKYSYDRYNQLTDFQDGFFKISRNLDPKGFVDEGPWGTINRDKYGRIISYNTMSNSMNNLYNNKGLLDEMNEKFRRDRVKTKFTYKADGQLKSLENIYINKKFSYDKYGKITKEVSDSYNIDYTYNKNVLTKISPYIESIEYYEHKRVKAIKFDQSSKIVYKYNDWYHLTSISYYADAKLLYEERYEVDDYGKLKSRSVNSAVFSKKNTYQYNKEGNIILPNALDQGPLTKGKVEVLSKRSLRWNSMLLSSINGIKHYYDSNSSLKFSDYYGKKLYFLNTNEYFLNNKHYTRINVAGKTVGIIVGSKFYHVIENYRGSITALIDNKKIIFVRFYDDWGNKTVEFTSDTAAKNLEKEISWSFAYMRENPLLGDAGKNLYWSKTRAYSAEQKSWLSYDSKVLFSPYSLLNQPGNWNPTRYCGNDPVNYVDPSGRSYLLAGVGLGSVVPGVGTAAGAFVGAVIDGAIVFGALVALAHTADKITSVLNESDSSKSGSHAPDRKLPRDKDGNPIPDSDAPHTQLGKKKGRSGEYTQGREWQKDADGNLKPSKDIDFTDHGRPDHSNPHQHDFIDNPSGGTPQRGPAKPLN